jgi:hypothetical protein
MPPRIASVPRFATVILFSFAYAAVERSYLVNVLLWVLQAFAALVYGASGVMKVCLFDK